MKRGDLVTIAMQGDFGKPRPALVLQSDVFSNIHETVSVALLSSNLIQAPIFRLNVIPDDRNGLTKECQIQIDKIMSVRKEKIGKVIGTLDDTILVRVNRALALWLGLA
jgi:mRNA interferase MazF